MKVLPTWISRAWNLKTGPIPTAYCGQSLADMEWTCKGCALREKICYAWKGTPKLGFGAMAKTATNNRTNRSLKNTKALRNRYSLDNALRHRHPKAKAVRIGALGDPSRIHRPTFWAQIQKIRAVGLSVLAYTHFWREWRNRALSMACMASCDNLSLADTAIAKGWVPAAIAETDGTEVTTKTPEGNDLLFCPAQRAKGVTCNSCRLCDPIHPFWTKQTKIKGIAFREH